MVPGTPPEPIPHWTVPLSRKNRQSTTAGGWLTYSAQSLAGLFEVEGDLDVRPFLGTRSGLDVLTRSELAERMAAGDVVVLDVRPQPEFRSGHIAGAVSVPVRELADRLEEP